MCRTLSGGSSRLLISASSALHAGVSAGVSAGRPVCLVSPLGHSGTLVHGQSLGFRERGGRGTSWGSVSITCPHGAAQLNCGQLLFWRLGCPHCLWGSENRFHTTQRESLLFVSTAVCSPEPCVRP